MADYTWQTPQEAAAAYYNKHQSLRGVIRAVTTAKQLAAAHNLKAGPQRISNEYQDFQKQQQAYVDQLRQSAQAAAELNAARQQRAVQRNVTLGLAHRGIEGGLAGSIAGVAQSQLAGETAQTLANFDQQMNQIMQQQAAGFLTNEYGFFHQLQAMRYQTTLQEELMAAQARLQADQNRWSSWAGVLSGAAKIVAGYL